MHSCEGQDFCVSEHGRLLKSSLYVKIHFTFISATRLRIKEFAKEKDKIKMKGKENMIKIVVLRNKNMNKETGDETEEGEGKRNTFYNFIWLWNKQSIKWIFSNCLVLYRLKQGSKIVYKKCFRIGMGRQVIASQEKKLVQNQLVCFAVIASALPIKN